MANELATISNYAVMSVDAEEFREAAEANGGIREADLTRVSTPAGGGTTWMIPGLAGVSDDQEIKELVGVLVHQQPRSSLWASDEPAEGARPVAVSFDMVFGRRVADRADVPPEMNEELDRCTDGQGRIDWTRLSYAQWDSGKGGIGKRVKDARVLYILRESDNLPIVVTIPPGSLAAWQKFLGALTMHGLPYFRAIVGLSLEADKSQTGIRFSRVVPRLVSAISREDAVRLRTMFGDALSGQAG